VNKQICNNFHVLKIKKKKNHEINSFSPRLLYLILPPHSLGRQSNNKLPSETMSTTTFRELNPRSSPLVPEEHEQEIRQQDGAQNKSSPNHAFLLRPGLL